MKCQHEMLIKDSTNKWIKVRSFGSFHSKLWQIFTDFQDNQLIPSSRWYKLVVLSLEDVIICDKKWYYFLYFIKSWTITKQRNENILCCVFGRVPESTKCRPWNTTHKGKHNVCVCVCECESLWTMFHYVKLISSQPWICSMHYTIPVLIHCSTI